MPCLWGKTTYHSELSFSCFFLVLLLVIFLLILTIRLLTLPLHLILLLALISSSALLLAGVLTELLQFLSFMFCS